MASSSDFNEKGNKTSKDKKYLDENEANEIVSILKNQTASISSIKESSRSGKPPKPFKTTSLQSSARSNLGFQPRKTMSVAQRLYQEGLITYMRTDSIRLSDVQLKPRERILRIIFLKNTYLILQIYMVTAKMRKQPMKQLGLLVKALLLLKNY